MRELIEAVRPGLIPRLVAETDEAVFHGGGEVFRLPLTITAASRQRALVKGLPRLRNLVPVAVPVPRWVGVMADGVTPFTGERRLPGVEISEPTGIAAQQWQGVLAALDAVSPAEAQEWGGIYLPTLLLADPHRGVLTGLVEWH